MNAADCAIALHRRGFAPLPLKAGSKIPVIEGWPAYQFDPEAAKQVFPADANIGVICGERSGGLVDVDFDCPEAAEIAADYMPPTGATFGRKSRRVSHRLYRTTDSAASKKYLDPVRLELAKQEGRGSEAAMIVELRGDGAQTMFPGSIHPTDGPVTWVDDGEPATVSRDMLNEACLNIVRAVLVQRYGGEILESETVRNYLDGLSPAPEIPLSQRAKAKAPPVSKDRGAAYGAAALDAECERVRHSANGSRNDQLYSAALKAGSLVASGCIDESDALNALTAAASDAGLTKKETTLTIRSGFKVGKTNPREPLERARAKDIASTPSSGVGVDDDDTPWPALSPINADLPAVLPFDPDTMLPAAWRGQLADKADRLQCRPDLLAVPAVCGFGSLLGANVRLRLKQHDRSHEICANIWGAPIDNPSSGKSPAMSAALAPLYNLQETAIASHEDFLKQKAVSDERTEMQRAAAKKQAQKVLDKGDEDCAERAEQILNARPNEPDKDPPAPAFIVNSTTVAKLGVTLNENPHGVLMFQDELSGWLASIDGEEKQEDRAFYLVAYNGLKPHRHDTISRGSTLITNTCVTVLGGIQPSKIAPLVRGAVTGATNDGLIQRLQLAVYPDPMTTWTYVDRDDDRAAKDAYHASFRGALEYRNSLDGIAYWRFSTEAQALFADWYAAEMTAVRTTHMLGAIASHLIKLDKTVGSLALIFELADGGRDGVVGVEAMQRALTWVPYLKSHANRIYSSADTMGATAARELVKRRRHLEAEFTANSVVRKGWGFGLNDRELVFEALDILIAEGYLRGRRSKGCSAGGRPTAVFRWHPGIDDFMSGARDDG